MINKVESVEGHGRKNSRQQLYLTGLPITDMEDSGISIITDGLRCELQGAGTLNPQSYVES